MKKKIDIIILGGSGLLGLEIIKKFKKNKKKILNLDIKNKVPHFNNYFFEKFNMSSLDLEANLKKIIKKYSTPEIYIDCSYINRNLFNDISFKNISRSNLNCVLTDWLSPSIIICSLIMSQMKNVKKKASIILTSSIYGIVSQDPSVYKNTNIKENIGYSLVKSGINNFVKNAATQYGQFNIRVNSVCPGGIENKQDKNFKDKNFKKNYLKKVPMNRFSSPEEIANIYEFLSSEKSSYITGINLVADGGYTLT